MTLTTLADVRALITIERVPWRPNCKCPAVTGEEALLLFPLLLRSWDRIKPQPTKYDPTWGG